MKLTLIQCPKCDAVGKDIWISTSGLEIRCLKCNMAFFVENEPDDKDT